MTIGEEVLIYGYIDEIRKDIVIIRNEGGYFGTVPEEIRSSSEIPNTCGDAISRQAVLDAMYELCDTGETLKENPWRDNPHIDAVVEAIEELPSVTPQQRMGRWIPVGYDGYADGNPVYDWWECSECGWEHTGDEESLTAFCPYCGAKMEVEE